MIVEDASHGRRTLGIAGLAALATYLDTTILFVAFPDITASVGDSSASTLSWVLNLYTIAFAALLVPAGKVADRVGYRRAFLIGSGIAGCCPHDRLPRHRQRQREPRRRIRPHLVAGFLRTAKTDALAG